jgi:hypothetical protein
MHGYVRASQQLSRFCKGSQDKQFLFKVYKMIRYNFKTLLGAARAQKGVS